MEFLAELLFELIFEGCFELSSNKKLPRYVRYPFIILIVLFFLTVILGLIFLGFMILDKTVLGGVFIILVGIMLGIGSVIKFKQVYAEKKDKIKK